jgi:hypothetical protein
MNSVIARANWADGQYRQALGGLVFTANRGPCIDDTPETAWPISSWRVAKDVVLSGNATEDDNGIGDGRSSTYSQLRDHPLVQRGRELMAVAQRSDEAHRQAAVEESAALLDQARRQPDPHILTETLRAASIVRLVTPGMLGEARAILDEMLDHARTSSMIVAEADAHALRANREFRVDPESHMVLDELANALAILEEQWPAHVAPDTGDWAEQVARAFSDAAIVLHHLDIHEMAAALLAQGQRHLEVADQPHGMVVLLFNRVRSHLLWGLQLERTGQAEHASQQFARAVTFAAMAEEYWQSHLFPDRADCSAADQVVVFAAAYALQKPGGDHLQRLGALRASSVFPDDPVLLDIAEARCLARVGRRDEATELLQKHPMSVIRSTRPNPQCVCRWFGRLRCWMGPGTLPRPGRGRGTPSPWRPDCNPCRGHECPV